MTGPPCHVMSHAQSADGVPKTGTMAPYPLTLGENGLPADPDGFADPAAGIAASTAAIDPTSNSNFSAPRVRLIFMCLPWLTRSLTTVRRYDAVRTDTRARHATSVWSASAI